MKIKTTFPLIVNQVRPQVPGSRPSYVYPPGPNDNINAGNSWRGNEPRYWQPSYNPNPRGRGNISTLKYLSVEHIFLYLLIAI